MRGKRGGMRWHLVAMKYECVSRCSASRGWRCLQYRRKAMMQINKEDDYELLRCVGFTEVEINRLLQLRQNYRISIPLDYARLRFVRWLVTTGRLTDEVVA